MFGVPEQLLQMQFSQQRQAQELSFLHGLGSKRVLNIINKQMEIRRMISELRLYVGRGNKNTKLQRIEDKVNELIKVVNQQCCTHSWKFTIHCGKVEAKCYLCEKQRDGTKEEIKNVIGE